VVKLRERISVSKQARQKYDLESLDESFDINNEWENTKENITTSAKDNLRYHRLKHNKPWFDDGCSKLIDERKQAKLQW
jgi:hypothetical protein